MLGVEPRSVLREAATASVVFGITSSRGPPRCCSACVLIEGSGTDSLHMLLCGLLERRHYTRLAACLRRVDVVLQVILGSH